MNFNFYLPFLFDLFIHNTFFYFISYSRQIKFRLSPFETGTVDSVQGNRAALPEVGGARRNVGGNLLRLLVPQGNHDVRRCGAGGHRLDLHQAFPRRQGQEDLSHCHPPPDSRQHCDGRH